MTALACQHQARGSHSRWYKFRDRTLCRAVEWLRLRRARGAREAAPNDLVSVIIATYNRSGLLTTRALPSVLAGSYRDVEVLVVGDHCTDDTAARVAALGDPRMTFINLPERSHYPEDPFLRWLVAGGPPANHGLRMARGAWLCHLDDDDEFTPDHVERLLSHARQHDCEVVYGLAESQRDDGTWGRWGPIRRSAAA